MCFRAGLANMHRNEPGIARGTDTLQQRPTLLLSLLGQAKERPSAEFVPTPMRLGSNLPKMDRQPISQPRCDEVEGQVLYCLAQNWCFIILLDELHIWPPLIDQETIC